jgi:UDP:flavonoid glycosyltransferase YjiC (YdhE family)
MSTIVMCATPVYGHVAPLITIGRSLVASGHRVRMLTGSRFADAVTAAGLEHVALPTACDYDSDDLEGTFPAAAGLTGVRRLRFDIENVFVGVLSDQYQALAAELDRDPADVVIGETAFLGLLPLIQGSGPRPRPTVVVCGVLPLTVSSRDTAPFGLGMPPSTSPIGLLRNAILNLLVSKVIFGRAHRLTQRQLRALGAAPLPCFVLDAPTLADHLLQLTVAGFEYPRRDLAPAVDYIGPVFPRSAAFDPPEWWTELDAPRRPVVLVTQGTVANSELRHLVGPTIAALADEDVLVVVTTGDESTAAALAATAPSNVRVASFVPYDRLLGKVDLMVTNGGYGGVQFALAHGVPLIVAGDTEEKPDIAARVAWSGAGINLKTGTPSVGQIRDAVHQMLSDPGFRLAATTLQEEIAESDPLRRIEHLVTRASSAKHRVEA